MQETKSHSVLRVLRSTTTILVLSLCGLPLAAQSLTKAEDLYKRTDYSASLALLDKSSNDPATEFLMGRDYFMLGDFKKATDYLQKAVAAQPTSCEYMDWLGRAYGKRAELANPFSAPAFAVKARQAFERAVAIDPKNSDALGDLFDYYLNAPGFLGGGHDKALVVADKISAIDPPEGYFSKAKVAEKEKEYSMAEERMRQAVAAAPYEIGHLIALAKLLATEGRLRESDDMFEVAEKVNPNAPRLWFARADVLIRQKRNLAEAKNLLQKYVKASITVDDPPKQEALRLLQQVNGA